MPLFDFKCQTCGNVTELFFRMADKPTNYPCECGGESKQMFTIGGVQGDELPAWFDREARGCLGDHGKVTTRSEYKQYLKDHNIAESSARSER